MTRGCVNHFDSQKERLFDPFFFQFEVCERVREDSFRTRAITHNPEPENHTHYSQTHIDHDQSQINQQIMQWLLNH